MTKLQKVLWRIAGIAPLLINMVVTVFILPLNYYSGVRERIGDTAWTVLIVLSLLVPVPLIYWNAYCVVDQKERRHPAGRDISICFTRSQKPF